MKRENNRFYLLSLNRSHLTKTGSLFFEMDSSGTATSDDFISEYRFLTIVSSIWRLTGLAENSQTIPAISPWIKLETFATSARGEDLRRFSAICSSLSEDQVG